MTANTDLAVERSDAVERGDAAYVLRKLPEVTALFWLVKTVAVTLGETLGDLLGITLGLGYFATAGVFLAFLAAAVTAQVRAPRLRPALYWPAVLGTSLVGTEISDLLNRGFGHGSVQRGVGYAAGALMLTAVLLIVFLVWWHTGQTYDVEAIASRQGEILYWFAILASNTLGTSSGDWLADDTGLGFRGAFLLIAIVLTVLAAMHYLTAVNATALFWPAFVLTRPLGAAGGDALTKPIGTGGLGWGTAWGSAALAAALIGLILHQTRRVRRCPPPPLPVPVNRRTGRPQRPNGGPASPPHAPRARQGIPAQTKT